MQNNSPKIPVFLSIMFFFIFLFGFIFLHKAIINNNKESQLREEEWQTETSRRDEIKALDHSVKIIEEEIEKLGTHFGKSSDIVPFLDTIEKLAPKVNAEAEVTSVDILKDHTGLLVIMKASGTFENIYKFLTLLENSQYELEFVGIDIHRGTEGNTESEKVSISKWDAIFKIKLLSFIE